MGTPARLAEVLAPFAVERLGRPADWIRTSACAGEDGMVIVRDMGFISLCEHHLLPFFGGIHVGCMPRRRTCDADCCAGVVAKVARRLQLQERLTEQIADALFEALEPDGLGSPQKGDTCA